jgi:hypothetical protein
MKTEKLVKAVSRTDLLEGFFLRSFLFSLLWACGSEVMVESSWPNEASY